MANKKLLKKFRKKKNKDIKKDEKENKSKTIALLWVKILLRLLLSRLQIKAIAKEPIRKNGVTVKLKKNILKITYYSYNKNCYYVSNYTKSKN